MLTRPKPRRLKRSVPSLFSSPAMSASPLPRVLVLARHTGLQQLAVTSLRGRATVTRAFSATLALAQLQEHPHALVIAEAHLPRPFTGTRFLESVRALEGYAAVPIVGLGWEMDLLPEQADKHLRHQGYDGCLINPKVPADFQGAIIPLLPAQSTAAA